AACRRGKQSVVCEPLRRRWRNLRGRWQGDQGGKHQAGEARHAEGSGASLKGEIERAEIRHLLRLGELREQAFGLGAVAVRRQLEELVQELVARERHRRRALEIA